MRSRCGRPAAFSLIELVIVVVIIGIIAAIAIPRMSRGSTGAAESALASDMAQWRKVLDLYQAEHGNFPDPTNVANQLTQYTDASGGTSATADSTHIYGPYLRVIPVLPVGTEKGGASIVAEAANAGAPSAVVNTGTGCGWVYDPAGTMFPNTGAQVDATQNPYTKY